MAIIVRLNGMTFLIYLYLFSFLKKKLNLDLAELRKEKEDLLKKLESSSEITSLAEEVSRVTVPRIQITSVGPSRSMDLEIKQLQCKLKVNIYFIKDENMY